MSVDALRKLPGVEFVRTTSTTLFIVTKKPKELQTIYTDKELVIIPTNELLTHPRMLDFLCAAKQSPITCCYLFSYDTSHLPNTKKQSFSHALSGTGGRKGFLTEHSMRKVGRQVLLVPADATELLSNFLDEWNVSYEKEKIFLEAPK